MLNRVPVPYSVIMKYFSIIFWSTFSPILETVEPESEYSSSQIENKIKQELNLFEQKAKDLGVDVKGVKEYQSLNRIVKDDIPEYMRIFKQVLKVDTL